MSSYPDDLEHTSIYTRDPNDSEESDGEGGLGNLSRLIVRPPGHSGKAKRGHLCFDAAFECGNLGRADHITELEYDLFIRPDTCRPRSRFWFNFTVENVKQDQRVIFNIVNLGKERTLFNSDMTPLVRSTSRHKWQRIPRRLIFYHRSAAHHNKRVLSFAFGFDREEDIYQFTVAAPYSYSRLQKYLNLWEKRSQAFAKREAIAQTTQKRRVDLLTIGELCFKEKETRIESPVKKKPVDNKQRLVLIIARSHGGDAPTSFVLQGFLDYIVGSSDKASALRNGIVIQVVPMLNPDGVFLGNQRSDLLGSDPNRSWNRATSFAHPALVAVNELLNKITNEKTVQLDFIIDLHADISHEGAFIRGNSYDDVYRFERHAVLPKFLAARIESWRTESCFYNADSGTAGAARRLLPGTTVDAYSLMVSAGGRRLAASRPYMHYTEDTYAKIGRSLVKALCDYYRHVGVISPMVGDRIKKEPRSRRRRKRPQTNREDRSPSSSPERPRRALPPRNLSPPLPEATAPPTRALRPRLTRHPNLASKLKSNLQVDPLLPLITGTCATRSPRLAVLDLCSHIRAPIPANHRYPRLARPPRPYHFRVSSDHYDTNESDS